MHLILPSFEVSELRVKLTWAVRVVNLYGLLQRSFDHLSWLQTFLGISLFSHSKAENVSLVFFFLFFFSGGGVG